MPITRHVAGLRPAAGPDYDRALKPIEALGLEERDPVRQIATSVVRRGRTEQTARQYGWMIARHVRWFRDHRIEMLAATRDDVLFWWNASASLSPAARQQQLVVLRNFYKEAVERELVVKDPTRIIAIVRPQALNETPALTVPQVERLLASMETELGHPDRGLVAARDLAIVAMMLRLCLRESEVGALRWSMFELNEDQRTVAFIGKWHKVSRLSVPADVWAALERWRSDFESETGIAMAPRDPVFTGLSPAHLRRAEERKKGVPLAQMGRAALYTLINARLRDVGLEGARMGPHALRATGATLAYEAGADLIECQMLLRHDSVETTRRFYLKRIDGEARGGMEKMPVRFRVAPPNKAAAAGEGT